MTKIGPWSQIKIPKALEKEHKAELKAKSERKKIRMDQKNWYKDYCAQYMQKSTRDPREELSEKGYTIVNNEDELISVLQSVLEKGGNVDIDMIYEEPDDEKDLP